MTLTLTDTPTPRSDAQATLIDDLMDARARRDAAAADERRIAGLLLASLDGQPSAEVGAAVVRRASTVTRRRVRHDDIHGRLMLLADSVEHRIIDGVDIGSDAARLRLVLRCATQSWRWSELKTLGIDTSQVAVEQTTPKVSVTIAGETVTVTADD